MDDVKLAEAADGTPLAVAQAHFAGGGPQWTVSMNYDSGSVPRYSYMFLAGSIIVFLIVLPFLDRAEKKRKDVPDRRERARLVRPGLGKEGAMIGAEVPLLDQGSVQFILLGVMILAVLALLWITIAK